jgi:predicted Zn-dependent peptidase
LRRRIRLSNGIRVVTESVPASRSVSIGVLVAAGPQDDPSDKPGLAHFTEHALFQGTSNRDAVDISRLMDVAGGQMGAFTSRDYTCFYANVLDDYCPYALDLLGDILLNSTFPEENLEREKHAVAREIDMSRDTPSDRVHTLLKEAIWPNHPLGRAIHGDPAAVRGMTREDVIYFVHKNYLPDRMIIAASGNLDHVDFAAHVQDAFWRMLGESGPEPPRRCRPRATVTIERAPVYQAYFALGLPVGGYADPDRYTVHVLNALLGGGLSSRLFRQLREERGLVYNIQSEWHAYRDAGLLVIEGSTAPESLMQVLALTMLELSQLAALHRPPDEEELWKAKMQIRGQHLLAAENTHTRMSRLATQEFYFGRLIGEDEVLAGIDAVGLDELAGYAERLLAPSLAAPTVAVVGPEIPACFSEASIRELLDSFTAIQEPAESEIQAAQVRPAVSAKTAAAFVGQG